MALVVLKKRHGQTLQHTNLEGISTISNGFRLHQDKNTHDESDKYTYNLI